MDVRRRVLLSMESVPAKYLCLPMPILSGEEPLKKEQWKTEGVEWNRWRGRGKTRAEDCHSHEGSSRKLWLPYP